MSETETASQPPALSRPRRRGLAWAGVVILVLAITLTVIGHWNPWNLRYVDRWLNGLSLVPIYVAGLGMLWHLGVRNRLARLVGFTGLGCVVFLWLLAWAAVSVLREEPIATMHAASPHNDLEADLVGYHNTWTVWLRADRGLLSREHRVGRVGYGDSYPPEVEAGFSTPDELTVTADGRVVYRVRFDPHDLDVEHEQCFPPSSLLLRSVGCLP